MNDSACMRMIMYNKKIATEILMNATTPALTLEVKIPELQPNKFERERAAFSRLLPQLLSTYRGKFVAIHGEQVADSGPNRLEVAMRVLQRVGNVDIFVGLVSDQPEPLGCSGVRREIGPG